MEACQAKRAISTTWRRELLIHAILTETLGEHAPSYATVKNWVAQFNVVIFEPVLRLVLDDTEQ